MAAKKRTTKSADAVILGVLGYEFPFHDRGEAEHKIRRRLRYYGLGVCQQERVDLLRRLKDEIQGKILRAGQSRYFSSSYGYVDLLAFPRHYVAERKANVHARDLLLRLLRSFGYTPHLQGAYDNIVATSGGAEGPFLLLGAHYDSVPGCPGADDNASAVAVCLECARLLKEHEIGSTMIVLFNREEDGLLGSREFVAQSAAGAIEQAHIFEMVGFCNRASGSQRMPPGLPGVVAPDVGDFLGLLANRHSNALAENLLALASTYVPQFPVLALKIYLGIEKYFGHLLRSDHAPFWDAGIASIMWTDTSEFRNPHYHRASDTPDTLDYGFLSNVAKLALAQAVSRAGK